MQKVTDIRLIAASWSFFLSSPLVLYLCARLSSLHGFIGHRWNSRQLSRFCGNAEHAVMRSHPSAVLDVSLSRPVPSWVASLHAAVWGNARLFCFSSSPEKGKKKLGQLHSSTSCDLSETQLECNLGSSLWTLTPEDYPSVPTPDRPEASTQLPAPPDAKVGGE